MSQVDLSYKHRMYFLLCIDVSERGILMLKLLYLFKNTTLLHELPTCLYAVPILHICVAPELFSTFSLSVPWQWRPSDRNRNCGSLRNGNPTGWLKRLLYQLWFDFLFFYNIVKPLSFTTRKIDKKLMYHCIVYNAWLMY